MPALPLALIVLLSAAFASRWALSVDEWRVMTDELSYVKLAQSIADTLSVKPRLRGEPVFAYSQLYPLLLAPLVGLFDFPVAFRLAHGLNALLMASTAIPTYLLVRLALRSPWPALAAAALSAAVPWLTLSLSLMTEAAAYPAFAWASYAAVLTVARPSAKHDVLALVAVVVAYLARTQFAYLVLALPLTVVLHEIGYRLAGATPRHWPRLLVEGARASATRHPVLAVCVALGAGAAVLFSAYAPLGNYQTVTASYELFSPGMFESLWEHVNQIAIGVGVLPLVITLAWLGETLIRPASRPAHALAMHTLIVVPALALIVTYFDLNYGGGVHERYLFYIVPLLFVGAVVGIATIRWPLASIGAAALAVIVVLVQSDYPPTGVFSVFSSPVRLSWTALDFRSGQLGEVVGFDDLGLAPVVALATALLCAGVAVALRGRWRRIALFAVPSALLVWMLALAAYAFPKVLTEHEDLADNSVGHVPVGDRDWIDEAVGPDADVAAMPSRINFRGGSIVPEGTVVDQGVWWQVEFWNKAVRRTYVYEGALSHAPFPIETLKLDARSGRLRVSGVESPYLVVSRSNVRLAPAGRVVSQADQDLLLYRPSRPYRAAWATSNLYDNGTMPNGRGRLTVYGRQRSGRRLHRVRMVLGDASTKTGSYRVRAPGVSTAGRIAQRPTTTFHVCVPAGGSEGASIRTAGGTDARIVQIDVSRLGRSCNPGAP